MKTVGTVLVILQLLIVNECAPESCPPEPFQCGQRPVEHPEKDNEDYEGPAYPGQWPWYGIVYHRKPKNIVEYACGGTLISEKHVLTSILCAKSKNGTLLNSEDVLFRIGTHKKNVLNVGYARHRQVIKIHQPMDYQWTSENKIVIFELSDKVKFNKYVQPACLSISFANLVNSRMLGWSLKGRSDNLFINDTTSLEKDRFHSVCETDPGGAYHQWMRTNPKLQFFSGIVDCMKPKTYNDEYHEYETFIFVPSYRDWIATITDLDYLRMVRKGQRYDPSKKYPNLLQRRNCGNENKTSLEYGPDAKLFEYPWMAMIFSRNNFDGSDDQFCTGTLISHRYVLTSAECYGLHDPAFVRLGEYDPRTNPDCDEMDCVPPYKDYDVEYSIKHPDYIDQVFFPSYLNNAIALVRTKKTILYEDHIQPICLPVTHNLRQKTFTTFIKTDWDYDGQLEVKNVLQKTMESLVNITECMSQYQTNDITKLSAVKCSVLSETRDYYKGAPLGNIVEYNGLRFVQYALLSRNFGKFLYTFIPPHMEWIIANMEE